MSELKAFESELIYWAVEQVERVAGDIDSLHLDDNLFYIKSEADKVIAEKDEIIDELKEDIDELQKVTDSAWSKVNAIYDELRHQKYKRCLAMARWCESEAYIHEHGSEYDEDLVAWFGKWYKRWLELADKFKEAK